MRKKLAYGIDFGTTNTTIAIVNDNNQVVKIPIDSNANDQSVMRSLIYVDPSGEFSFGNSAVDKYLESIEVVKDVGYQSISTGRYVKVLNSNNTYETVAEIADVEINPNGRLLQSLKSALANNSIQKINLFGKHYLIEELVGMFLKEIKNKADRYLGNEVESAVVGRPVEYVGNNNDLAVERMKYAIKYAGFTDFRFEYEPTGAAYDYENISNNNQNILIFDFGGGTLDISVLQFPEKKILSNIGLRLGGDSFNTKIFTEKLSKYFGSNIKYGIAQQKLPRYIFNSLESWYGITLLKSKDFYNQFDNFRYNCSDSKALNCLKSLVFNNLGFKLYENIENVKKQISNFSNAKFKLVGPEINIENDIYKLEFEMMILDDLNNIKELLDKALISANLKYDDIDKVVTTGGSSLIPSVKSLLIDKFGEGKIVKSDTFTSVASGLAKIAK